MRKKITVFGGGTGQSNLLRGLKKYDTELTAVVTMADDGGGSGKLREETGMLPPGDVRNCIIALSNIEPSMEMLMQHRFREGSLRGQSFGNLFLAALNEIYGDFELAVSKISEILAVKGRVLPVTLDDVRLIAMLENGNIVNGECNISAESISQNSKISRVLLSPADSKPFKEVIDKIENSDIIVLGPGSLYTSLIPNIITPGIAEAIFNSRAVKLLISNIMTENGETTGYNIEDHIKAIYEHSGYPIIDAVISNNQPIEKSILKRYLDEGQTPLFLDTDQRRKIRNMGITVIEKNLITVKDELLMHDSDKIAKTIMTSRSYSKVKEYGLSALK